MFGTPLYFMPGTQEQHGALLDRTCIHTRILIFHCNLCQAHQGTVALALHLIKHTHTHTHTSTHLLAPLCNLCQAHQGAVALAPVWVCQPSREQRAGRGHDGIAAQRDGHAV